MSAHAAGWAGLTEARDVHLQASQLLEQINGARPLIRSDAEPVNAGAVVEFDEQRNRHVNVMIQGVSAIALAGGVRASVSGEAPSTSPPTESQLQKWIKIAEADDVRAEASDPFSSFFPIRHTPMNRIASLRFLAHEYSGRHPRPGR